MSDVTSYILLLLLDLLRSFVSLSLSLNTPLNAHFTETSSPPKKPAPVFPRIVSKDAAQPQAHVLYTAAPRAAVREESGVKPRQAADKEASERDREEREKKRDIVAMLGAKPKAQAEDTHDPKKV